MKKELFAELLHSVKEAAAIERGKLPPSRQFEIAVTTGSDCSSGARAKPGSANTVRKPLRPLRFMR
jgi:hypothetical protein